MKRIESWGSRWRPTNITKPFSNRELLARVRAVLRRCQARQSVAALSRGTRRRAYRFAGREFNARAKGRNIPVILMSGNVTAALEKRARANRVCVLLHKPLSREALAAALARCLRQQEA